MPTTIAQQCQQERTITMMQVLDPNTEKFRFHSILNAPTAMIKHADEIPITYLNKGQTYSLVVIDTDATGSVAPGTKYRTFVRVSFEKDEQRQKPGVCWGIWKEGRGTNEAQRGGKLQAVEYVESGQSAKTDERKTKMELESFSFDGFCVTWMTGASGIPVANIALRFIFLSTDFSYSKGVMGIPVRLCAKTNLVLTKVTANEANMEPEFVFAKSNFSETMAPSASSQAIQRSPRNRLIELSNSSLKLSPK